MKQRFSNIIIKGKCYGSDDLPELANEKILSINTLAWEKTLFQFILDWISDSSTLKVNTSGSTGQSKTILLEKEKMIQSALRTGEFFQLNKNEKALLCLPTDFIAGKMMVVRAFVLGLDLFPIEPKANPLEFIDEDFHFAAMTPMQVSNIFKNIDRDKKLNQIQNLIIGGGEISKELVFKISKLKNNTWHTYGMTETITHVALKKLNGPNPTNYFEPLPDVIFEKDQRECLIIRATYLSDKPIITNDIVKLASNTKFEFIGRFDNVINTGGVKVSPEKVENKLQAYFDQRIIISGIPDEILGSKVVLVIEGIPIRNLNLEVIYINVNLSKYEIPKQVFFLDKFPETDNGKIIRKKLPEILIK